MSKRLPARLWLLLIALVGTMTACPGDQATPEFCRAVLDRIVEVELNELGFRDPALAEMKKRDLGKIFAGDVQRCVGRRIPPRALACIQAASSTEQISHQCLR